MSESEEASRKLAPPVRPDEWLNGIAAAAWQAFNAMETTKRRHFSLLEIMDSRKQNYNIDPSAREISLLDFLLRDHDEQVRRFTEASMQLKVQDAQAHKALFIYIGQINQDNLSAQQTH